MLARLLALKGHANDAGDVCFQGQKRTCLNDRVMSAFDPLRKWGSPICCDAQAALPPDVIASLARSLGKGEAP
jgi:hypothetical protein